MKERVPPVSGIESRMCPERGGLFWMGLAPSIRHVLKGGPFGTLSPYPPVGGIRAGFLLKYYTATAFASKW